MLKSNFYSTLEKIRYVNPKIKKRYKFYKVKVSPKHVSLRKNWHVLLLIITGNLNAHVIPAQEHQIVHSSGADQMWILKTLLCKYWEYQMQIPNIVWILRMKYDK